MAAKRWLGALLVVGLSASALAPPPAGSEPAPPELLSSLVGQWSGPYAWPLEAIHGAVLPTGKVLVWAGQNNVKLWDPGTNTLADARLGGPRNIFCSAHTLLPDGRVLVVGGSEGGDEEGSDGHPGTHLYDPFAGAWQRGPDMAAGRWYPSAVLLPSGQALAVGGNDEEANANERVEGLTPLGWDLLEGAERAAGTFPRLFVLPSGEVLQAGPQARAWFLDPAAARWREGPAMQFGGRGGGGFALLPGDKVLAFGGARQGTVTNTAEILELGGTPAWRPTGSMMFPRVNLNPVLLADGSVLAVGGSPGPSKSPAVLAPERFDPVTERWSLMAPALRGRTYHSIALLLPDARVLVAGSDVELVEIPPGTLPRGVFPVLAEAGLRTAEVFSPPYLSQGPRPSIASAPARLGYGASFAVESPDAGEVARVALVKLGTVTHSTNFDQRLVELAFQAGGSTLQVTSPGSPAEAPPGWYMLFLLSGEGVPSLARMVQVG